jgi:sn-glycerol 3-phosphate transport system permease protein
MTSTRAAKAVRDDLCESLRIGTSLPLAAIIRCPDAMEKRALFSNKLLPYLLILPQLAITLVFFYWPASQAVWQSFLLEDAFGLSSEFIGFENYRTLLQQPEYYRAMVTTAIFSSSVAVLSLSCALLLATQADKNLKAGQAYKTLLIWPYAVAPAIAGVLWIFMFHPTLGTLARPIKATGVDWNPMLNAKHAMLLLILSATWKQISYNFLFFLAGLQAIPKSVIEAAAIDGAGPLRRFWTIIFPLLSPTTFFLIVVNIVYVFFDTFGIIDAVTGGGPAGQTTTLVYKVYADGRLGGDLGGSAAQSVILMVIVVALTAVQFKFVERKVQY